MVVVGAGPVGLSAAMALRVWGLSATVFEVEDADRRRRAAAARLHDLLFLVRHGEVLSPDLRDVPGN